MSEAIIASIITGGLTLIGTIITVLVTNNQTNENLKISQAVMDTKIEELTREVREHNNFAKRMPVLEEKLSTLNHRIEDIEKRGGQND